MLNFELISLPHVVPTAYEQRRSLLQRRDSEDPILDPLSGSLASWAQSDQEELTIQFPTQSKTLSP